MKSCMFSDLIRLDKLEREIREDDVSIAAFWTMHPYYWYLLKVVRFHSRRLKKLFTVGAKRRIVKVVGIFAPGSAQGARKYEDCTLNLKMFITMNMILI